MRNRLYDVARTSEQKEVEKEIRKRFRYGHGGYGSFKFATNSAKLQLKEYFEVKWEILDLADIDSSLSAKLTDEDIGAVFVCIDAKNHLKRFKLRNNSNFVGYGLELLRGSTVLEKLDLGLTRECHPTDCSEVLQTKLSDEVVLDILEDILRTEGNSFQRLQLPRKFWNWDSKSCHLKTDNEILAKFMTNHCALLINRSRCVYFGFDDDEHLCTYLREKGKSDVVNGCFFCCGTEYNTCSHCETISCESSSSCHGFYMDYGSCEDCGAFNCLDCHENGLGDDIENCGGDYGCDKTLCSSCRLDGLKRRSNHCSKCIKIGFFNLVQQNKELTTKNDKNEIEIDNNKEVIRQQEDWIHELQTEKEEQQEDIEQQEGYIEELQAEIEGLRREIVELQEDLEEVVS
jgi:hypothetical protein